MQVPIQGGAMSFAAQAAQAEPITTCKNQASMWPNMVLHERHERRFLNDNLDGQPKEKVKPNLLTDTFVVV